MSLRNGYHVRVMQGRGDDEEEYRIMVWTLDGIDFQYFQVIIVYVLCKETKSNTSCHKHVVIL